MALPPAPLVATRFAPLADGTWRDLATGGVVWLVRRTAADVVRQGWPEQAARVWHLWHPHLAPCVDFGWLGEAEWFDAYAIAGHTGDDFERASTAVKRAGVVAFLRAHRVTCELEYPSQLLGAAMPVPCDAANGDEREGGSLPGDHDPGIHQCERRRGRRRITPPVRSVGRAQQPVAPGLGIRLLPREAERRLLACLEEPLGVGPRLWRIDAPGGSGWRTSWRRLAREARLQGFLPVASPMLDVPISRLDGRVTSWLSLLGAARLLVACETSVWQPLPRQELARLLVRLGGAEGATVIVLDIVRHGRPVGGDVQLAPLESRALVSALWVDPRACARWSPAAALRAARAGQPGPFLTAATRMLSARSPLPMVHERAPRFAADAPDPQSAPSAPVGAIIERAGIIERRGRGAAAERWLRRAEGQAARRGDTAGAAMLLGELAMLAARRGDIARSRRHWDAALGAALPADVMRVARFGCTLAEQWMRQAAFREAERLLRAVRASALVVGDHPVAVGAIAGLTTCLCWQARWDDALAESAMDEPDGRVLAGRMWARLSLNDRDGAARDLVTAISLAGSADEREGLHAARLRMDIASGALERLEAALEANAGATAARLPTLAHDDQMLLPLEGLVRHGCRLPAAARAIAVRHAGRFTPRLCRARARLVLALDWARPPARRADLETEITRVIVATGAGALAPGTPLSAWPPSPKETATMLDEIVTLLRICQDGEEPGEALSRVCARLRERLDCAVVGVAAVIADAPAMLATTGRGELMTVARRAIDLHQPVHPADGDTSCAVPVMIGGHVVGALACAWRLPDARPAPASVAWLEAAATAIAPTVRLAAELAVRRSAAATPASTILGASAAIVALRAAIDAAARVPFTVLIEGESGSGKELVAREVHRLGARRGRAFCAVNCAALTDELCEAELFGHARGAFTGAVGERAGLFEEADGGMLFLDEVSELSPRAQAKLLRAIQEGEVRRLGETRARRVDVRLVAATNRPLAEAVIAGAFRADLRYRLDVVHITVPPLRERPEDIALLARHFWHRALERVDSRATLAPATVAGLTRYDWPGNVRELQNVLAALAVHAPRHGIVNPSSLPLAVVRRTPPVAETLEQVRRQADERAVRTALAHSGGHRGRAAEALGMTRQGLAKLVGRLQLDPPQRSMPGS